MGRLALAGLLFRLAINSVTRNSVANKVFHKSNASRFIYAGGVALFLWTRGRPRGAAQSNAISFDGDCAHPESGTEINSGPFLRNDNLIAPKTPPFLLRSLTRKLTSIFLRISLTCSIIDTRYPRWLRA